MLNDIVSFHLYLEKKVPDVRVMDIFEGDHILNYQNVVPPPPPPPLQGQGSGACTPSCFAPF